MRPISAAGPAHSCDTGMVVEVARVSEPAIILLLPPPEEGVVLNFPEQKVGQGQPLVHLLPVLDCDRRIQVTQLIPKMHVCNTLLNGSA